QPDEIGLPSFSRSKVALLRSMDVVRMPSPLRSSTSGLTFGRLTTVTVSGCAKLTVELEADSCAVAITINVNVPLKPKGGVIERLPRVQPARLALVLAAF